MVGQGDGGSTLVGDGVMTFARVAGPVGSGAANHPRPARQRQGRSRSSLDPVRRPRMLRRQERPLPRSPCLPGQKYRAASVRWPPPCPLHPAAATPRFRPFGSDKISDPPDHRTSDRTSGEQATKAAKEERQQTKCRLVAINPSLYTPVLRVGPGPCAQRISA